MKSKRPPEPVNHAGGPIYNLTINVESSPGQQPPKPPRRNDPERRVSVPGFAVIGLAIVGFVVLQLLGAGIPTNALG